MGTRLLSEQQVKNRFPQLSYIRIHTPSKHKATIYAWNGQLHLPEKEANLLKKYASGYLYPYVCYQIKPYHLVADDGVPLLNEIPLAIIQTAKRRDLNQYRIIEMINQLFPYGRLSFAKYDAAESMIHFDFHAIRLVPDRDKERMYQYLNELIPLGSYCEIHYD
ncbi:hypothetical protein GCM10008018_72320 [Paenibacillus marchantiophytorum]|uniref:Uncharacterized protein n=1 Tax=Paenibacillus marchantiophytorum TaxID=1619310 RepID=A0ABQ1FL32_9BACL|nr:hypothetical protein [Paenibacillus marchantiophytorum]GGA17692.1 hypothetical protein GCM10008018_72320 [Paenibacillus marchantiophytorum]